MVLRRSERVGVRLCDCNECCEQRPSTGEHERNALEPLPPLSRAAAAAHLQMDGASVGAHNERIWARAWRGPSRRGLLSGSVFSCQSGPSSERGEVTDCAVYTYLLVVLLSVRQCGLYYLLTYTYLLCNQSKYCNLYLFYSLYYFIVLTYPFLKRGPGSLGPACMTTRQGRHAAVSERSTAAGDSHAASAAGPPRRRCSCTEMPSPAPSPRTPGRSRPASST